MGMGSRITAIVIGAAVMVGGYGVVQGGGGGDPLLAHLWVDTNGGTCTRDAQGDAAYVDAAACSSLDVAWDAATAGDQIRVKAGTYTSQQVISGNKASDTFITGEDRATVIFNASSTPTTCGSWGQPNICVTATHVVLEDMTSSTAAESANSGDVLGINADSVTFNRVDADSDFGGSYVHAGGTNFTWNDSTIGSDTPGLRACGVGVSDVHIWVDAQNLTLDGLTFNPVQNTVSSDNDPNCPGDSHHFDTVRLQGTTSGFTLRNSYFMSNYSSHGGATTGHLFVTGGASNNATIVNNYFGPTTPPGNGNGWLDISGTCTSMQNWTVAYNTMTAAIVNWGACSVTGEQWIGNLGPDASSVGSCSTHVKNHWQGSGTCGTDTFTAGTDWSPAKDPVTATNNLDFSINSGTGDGILEGSSPALNAGETPGASDYCTGALGSLDGLGNVRPFGASCDAGWYERQS